MPSGIRGLDEITGGGLPRARPSLVCGGAGCGKTLFAMEFLVRGALEHGEPGVFMAFEESAEDLAANVASLGFDLHALEARRKLVVDHVHVDRSEITETGEYELEGLFVRLGHAIDQIGAKRVVLDTVETLFSGLPNPLVLRSELRRLFRWLKDRGMTVVITAEQGAGALTRHGLEEYVSDCVIFLDHRVHEEVSTRRLRIVKYRGSTHGTNEYPFLIDRGGLSVLPITSVGLDYTVSTERVPTGVPQLDRMLGGEGYFGGSTILVSGAPGTGKTTIAMSLALDSCRRGRPCVYFAFEESPSQLERNMASVGLPLSPHLRDGTLRLVPARPQSTGLEMHLVAIHEAVDQTRPSVVIMDPISNLKGTHLEARSMLTRLIDFLKGRGITALLTDLVMTDQVDRTEAGIWSLVDTWLVLEVVRSGGERRRLIDIVKSRGMSHSSRSCELRLTANGVEILDQPPEKGRRR